MLRTEAHLGNRTLSISLYKSDAAPFLHNGRYYYSFIIRGSVPISR
jgi:hypothetical protein